MESPLVNEGPAIQERAYAYPPNVHDPVALRMVGGLQKYNASTDMETDPPMPICRLDILCRDKAAAHLFVQRNIDLACERKVPPVGTRIGDPEYLWLMEPNAAGLRGVTMLVDRPELVAKLRALADEIEKLG